MRTGLSTPKQLAIERATMEVDIACVGFGPAMGGFLTTLTRAWTQTPRTPAIESSVVPGMPLQVICYERADDIASGVSGVVTRARGIRASFPDLDPAEIPMATQVTSEKSSTCSTPSEPAGAPAPAHRRSLLRKLGKSAASQARRLRIPLDCRHSCTRATGWSFPSASSTSG